MSVRGVSYGPVPVGSIAVGERLRRLDPDYVNAFAATIEDRGLLEPIGVVREDDQLYSLRYGALRLAAACLLGWETIPAQVVEAQWIKDRERRLDEIVSNVMRKELTKLERAQHLAELIAVYEELHPEIRHGGDRKSQAARNKRENQTAIFTIRSETAERVGLSDRAFRLAVSIWKGLSPESKERLHGTWLADHQAGLKLLAAQDHEIQAAILAILLAEKPEAATVADALALIDKGRLLTPSEKRFRSTHSALERLSTSDRKALFTYFEEEIRDLAHERGWV